MISYAVGLLCVFSLMWLFELPGMIRRRLTGEIVTFGVLWTLGLIVGILVVYDVPTDQISQMLRAVFEPVAKVFLKLPVEVDH